ncbi:MAG: hypothetical protein QW101_05125 [Ignisphaera sp.]|uniref:Uncharacterized protein n=1 Tax=Ignisphaera aggregans TaxID=334771 RepID=A0A7J3N0N9_9CREN
MARDGKKKSEKNIKKELESHNIEQKKEQQIIVHKTRSSSSKKYVDTESWVEKHLDELIDIFNLNMLELDREEAKAVAIKLVDILRGESSTLDKDTIKRRFSRYAQNMYQIIAQSVLELRESLSIVQLEFIVNNIGELVLGYAPRLYREAMEYGREDLIDIVRASWRAYWISKKYSMLPVECPRCKFNSLMPDLTCIVCGSTVSEEELKRSIDFEKILKELINLYSEEDVKKTIVYGYLYINSLGLKPPTHERDKLDIEVALNTKEKEILKLMLTAGKGEHRNGV